MPIKLLSLQENCKVQVLRALTGLVVASALLIGNSSIAQSGSSAAAEELITDFWQASSENERSVAKNALVDAAPDALTLVNWLSAGPNYSTQVDVGVIQRSRLGTDGTQFPYAFIIPESYSPSRAYPVEFMLHGGVGRPKQEPGVSLWRSGYDNLKREDRIVVVPGAWRDAYWWQSSQADNLPEILRLLKQQYNIDENRVTLSGVSDGGTGAYFFAFKQPTPWASFLPFIGHPGVLRNANSGGGYSLFFENLRNKPLYIVNGEVDRLYPAKSVQPFIDILEQSGVTHTFVVIANGGHNTQWLPEETPKLEAFKADNPRDPLPEKLYWVTDRTDRYNRNHWVQVNGRSKQGSPAILDLQRDANHFHATTDGVGKFTILLSPAEVDFQQPVTVMVNEQEVFSGMVQADKQTVLKWAETDLDRTMLFAAELVVDVDTQ